MIVIGSGASGLSAALTAAVGGADVLVLERTDKLGGTTTYSGGAMWIPNNRLMSEAGMPDSRSEVLTYLRRLTAGMVTEAMVEAFVDTCNVMVRFFEDHADLEMACRYEHADYQPLFDGAKAGGRCIENDHIVYLKELGEFSESIRHTYSQIASTFAGNLMTSAELNSYQQTGIPPDPEVVARRAAEGALMRGRGLVGCLLKAGRRRGVTAMLNCPATNLLMDGGRVTGVEVERNGTRERHQARLGVVIASGGFEWNPQLVRGFLGVPELTPASPPTNLGIGIHLAVQAGATLGNMTNAWWDVMMAIPGEVHEGKPFYRTSTTLRGRAGTIMVNRRGRRFVNESMNYADLAQVMKWFDPLAYQYPHMPCQLIFDRGVRERFGIGDLAPEDPDPAWLVKAGSVSELAELADLDVDGLEKQMERFNTHAARGEDPDFHRGEDPYDHYRGDPQSPHPNLRPLEPPFYALPQTLGCLGTKGGPLTNENSQVLDRSLRAIPGLYACGNAMSNTFGPSYPGPGATLGSGMTFGYRAGRHLAGKTTSVLDTSNPQNAGGVKKWTS